MPRMTEAEMEDLRVQLDDRMYELQQRYQDDVYNLNELEEPAQQVGRDLFLKLNLNEIGAWLYNVMPDWEVKIEVSVTDDRLDYRTICRPRLP